MVDFVCYPKRCITVEPFGNQIDVIEKALVEIENQPPRQYTYANQNTRRHNAVPFIPSMSASLSLFVPSNTSVFGGVPSEMSRGAYSEGYQAVPSVPPMSANTPPKQQPSPKVSTTPLIYTTFDPFQPDFKTDTQLASGSLSGYLSGSLSSTATSSSIWGNNDAHRNLNDATVWG